MKKLSLVLVLLLISALHANAWYPSSRVYDNNWYIQGSNIKWTDHDGSILQPPAVGETAKPLNKIQRILLKADKQRPTQWYRYQTHVSNREYTDCSYYKYIDCSNFTFCRCWQCRDYVYPVVRTNY